MIFTNEIGLRVRVCRGLEVPLPNDTTMIRVIRYPSSGLIEMAHESVPRRKLMCCSIESLAHALYGKTETLKSRRGRKLPTTKDTACGNTDDYPAFSTRSENEAANLLKNKQAEETSDSGSRGYKGLHQCYRKARSKVLSSVFPAASIWLTTTLSGKIPFAFMMKVVTLFGRWLKRWEGFRNAFVFPEPDEDGLGWHAHWFICFNESIPETAASAIEEWWWKHDTVPNLNNPFQIKMEIVGTLERLVRKLKYLNPTVGRKRSRMVFYPAAAKIYRSYGEVQKEAQAIAPFSVAEKLTKREFPSLRHSVEFTEPDSGEVIYSDATYFFEEKKLVEEKPKAEQTTDLFLCRAFVAPPNGRCDECPLRSSCGWSCQLCKNFNTDFCRACKHGEPHRTLRQRFDGQINVVERLTRHTVFQRHGL